MLSLLVEDDTIRHVVKVVGIRINTNQLFILLNVAPKSVSVHQIDDQFVRDVDFLFVRGASHMEAGDLFMVNVSKRIAELHV